MRLNLTQAGLCQLLNLEGLRALYRLARHDSAVIITYRLTPAHNVAANWPALGAGIGLTIRGGGVIDGTEILAISLSRKRSLSVGDFILIFNIIIFSVAAFLLSIEVALYSILTYLSASKTVDFILEGIEEFTGVTIISVHSDEIADMIKNKLGRGLTIYAGKKGFGRRGENPSASEIIFTVVTRLEISRLTGEVEKIDPNAFIVMQRVNDAHGGMVKKKPFAH